MSEVYSFRAGPSYRATNSAELFESAMAQPMSLTRTLVDQAVGGVVESFGLGTMIREMAIPEGARDTRDDVGSAIRLLNPLAGAYELTKRALQSGNADRPAMTEDEYKSSPYFRQDIPWDSGMTADRAAALADWYDARKVREYFASKRPITSFIGNLAGQAVDPINYIPIAGPAVRGASIARVAGASALDAAANTAVFGLLTQDIRRTYGDDVSWQRTVSEVAMAAMIGGAFGTISGALGRRRDAALDRQVMERLTTLQRTQEARVALNEAIGAVARGEDIRLSPNATEPVSRAARETAELSRAYDEVRANPTGPVRDPLVAITPDELDGMIVARGAFKDVNEVEFSKRGWGLVKVVWRHGEQSDVAPEHQVTKGDIVALPDVVRRFEPSSVSDDGLRREWRVERDGRTVVYADTMFEGGDRHLVTAFVEQADASSAGKTLSRERPALPGSRPQAGNLVEDTAGDRSIGTPGAGQSTPTPGNIAQAARIDNSLARAEPLPEGRQQAETSLARPDDYNALASQYRVDPETGDFLEMAEVEQLRAEGRLSHDEAAEMEAAQTVLENGEAYGEALKAAVRCMI